jgi:hypothetical protein
MHNEQSKHLLGLFAKLGERSTIAFQLAGINYLLQAK